MAAMSEEAKERKRIRTREWYRKAKEQGTFRKRIKTAEQKEARRKRRGERERKCARDWEKNRGPEYQSFKAMHQRCGNPNHKDYHNYGGRNVIVCSEWFSFEVFKSDMGCRPEGTTLDRIDPFGNYCKENCRWATPKEQSSNTRRAKQIQATQSQQNPNASAVAALGRDKACGVS